MDQEEYEESLQKLRDFNLEPVTRRMKERHGVENADELEDKFRRFVKAQLQMKAKGDDTPLSPHPETDEYWHEFILDTPRYQLFCEEIFGSFRHHIPGNPDETDYDGIDEYVDGMELWNTE